jgi:hypothetical protein
MGGKDADPALQQQSKGRSRNMTFLCCSCCLLAIQMHAQLLQSACIGEGPEIESGDPGNLLMKLGLWWMLDFLLLIEQSATD